MKILSPDARGQIDGTIHKNILDHLDHSLPVEIVPLSYFPDFSFVAPKVSGKWVCVDFMEPNDRADEYRKFADWSNQNPPTLVFKRELKKDKVFPNRIIPIEFPCVFEPKKSSDRTQFNARKFDVLYFWGMSNRLRPLLQGDIWRGMANDGISVLSHWDQIKGVDEIPADQRGPIWLSIYTPHWTRKPMNEILPIMAQSKITVAMPGNDSKTFRHAEIIDSILATQSTDKVWSYPWDANNSIQLVPNNEYNCLFSAIWRYDLYDIYCSCCDNMRNYFAPVYAKNYVQKEIENIL